MVENFSVVTKKMEAQDERMLGLLVVSVFREDATAHEIVFHSLATEIGHVG